MHDFLDEDRSWIETLADLDAAEPVQPRPSGVMLLQRIRASVPSAWVPIGRRGLSGLSARLPSVLRSRVHRLLGLLSPDMGTIGRDYPIWTELHDCVKTNESGGIIASIARMPKKPIISVLMPVFNPVPEHLSAAIQSVRDQLYPSWELCIGDDASTDAAVIAILRDAASRDHRIRLVRRERNGHISAASNSALRLASGPFVALLDHDDILPQHALLEVAMKIAAQPDVDIIYSDEDHIDNDGRRSHPYFKPDWNPELMLGQNLISHLGVYRRTLVERIGGFRTGFEGSQDHDLALRVVAETHAERIAHIPKVLYHWRQGVADRTFSEQSHDRCVRNGRRAVRQFITRGQPDAQVKPAPFAPSWTRIVYPIPASAPLVSVIVPYDGKPSALSHCIDALLSRTDYPALEILILADAGTAPALPDGVADHRVRILNHLPPSVNQAAQQARGSMLLLLDPYLSPRDPGWLRELVSQAARPDIGVVGAKLVGPDGTVRHAGFALGGPGLVFAPFLGRQRTQTGYFGHLQLARDVTAVSGKCLMIRRQAFLSVGGLDDALCPTALRDVDLCLKLTEAKLRVLWTPHAELYFREGAPRQYAETAWAKQGSALMRKRWGRRLLTDRYWSPNLSFHSFEMGLAFPPRIDNAEPPPAVVDCAAVGGDPVQTPARNEVAATGVAAVGR